jgi:hypothetical protein
MSQLTLIDSIKKETKIDDKGRATVSMRGTARIVDVKHPTLSRQFASGTLESSKLAEKLISAGFEGDTLESFSKTGIPDLALSTIIEYYAFDAGRYCTEQALTIYRTFAAIGLRTWLQDQTGWKNEPVQPQVTTAYTKALPCPELTPRMKIVRAIDQHVFLFKGSSHKLLWMAIYSHLKYTYHYDVAARLKNSGIKRSKLDQIEADGKLAELRSAVEAVLGTEVL